MWSIWTQLFFSPLNLIVLLVINKNNLQNMREYTHEYFLN